MALTVEVHGGLFLITVHLHLTRAVPLLVGLVIVGVNRSLLAFDAVALLLLASGHVPSYLSGKVGVLGLGQRKIAAFE